MPNPKPRIITQHEYISIDFGNGRRLTTSFSGQKATGGVPANVFKAWLAAMDAKSDLKIGERVQKFADEIDTLWPEWVTPPKTFAEGQEIVFDFGSRRGGKQKGVILKKKRTSYDIRFEKAGIINITGDMLAEQNP